MSLGLSQSSKTISVTNSNTFTIVGTTASLHFYPNKFSYDVLGKKIEVDSAYGDPTTAMCIALINTVGIQYYAELKKQSISFPGKIGEFLDESLKSYDRDNKILDLISPDEAL